MEKAWSIVFFNPLIKTLLTFDIFVNIITSGNLQNATSSKNLLVFVYNQLKKKINCIKSATTDFVSNHAQFSIKLMVTMWCPINFVRCDCFLQPDNKQIGGLNVFKVINIIRHAASSLVAHVSKGVETVEHVSGESGRIIWKLVNQWIAILLNNHFDS